MLCCSSFSYVLLRLREDKGFNASAPVPGCDTGAAILTALADGLFGRVGQVLLAAMFVIACFNTCVGLIASVGEYFHPLLPRLSYPAIAAFLALMSMLLANIGLADILSLSVPVLNTMFPMAIILIVVEFLPERFQRPLVSAWRPLYRPSEHPRRPALRAPLRVHERPASERPRLPAGCSRPSSASVPASSYNVKKLPYSCAASFSLQNLLCRVADGRHDLAEDGRLGVVEAIVRQPAAHRSGRGIVEHLQIGGDVLLHFLAVAVDDIALGQGLFGDRRLGHHADLLTQGGSSRRCPHSQP